MGTLTSRLARGRTALAAALSADRKGAVGGLPGDRPADR
jgi:hypothetical protein